MKLMEFNQVAVKSCQILVFRSNIDNAQSAALVCRELTKTKGVYHVNVDLEDWEKVLRVECDEDIHTVQIEKQIAGLGFECAELEDNAKVN